MDKTTTIYSVKEALGITDASRDLLIGDIWQNAVNYMNLLELPEELEGFVRGKVQSVIDYEKNFGAGNVLDVTSMTEGKCSWTYNINENNCRDSIYGFSGRDFSQLRRYRRTRR